MLEISDPVQNRKHRLRDIVSRAVEKKPAVDGCFVDDLMDRPGRNDHQITGCQGIGFVMDKIAASAFG